MSKPVKHRAMHGFLAATLFACITCSASNAPALAAAPSASATALAADVSHRASMQTMQIPSHGALMNALVYVAAGAGPHPAVILLHGFPGNERNLDLAQDMRRAGWDVLYFNYRGSWGTPGKFSFTHGIEDAAAALAYLRQPAVAKKLRLDPARIVLIGHSMGGFMAIEAAAADPAIKAFATISAADFGDMYAQMLAKDKQGAALKEMSEGLASQGMAPLSGCTPDSLAREVATHATGWTFQAKVDALKNRNVFVITSDDGLADANEAFAADLQKAGDKRVSTLHLPTDHSYSDQRIELSHALLQWLAPIRD